MPILDIQTRFRELGRIRTGIQVPNRGGRGTHPEKLPRFRLTSEWPNLIEQAAAVYGGEARPWDNNGSPEFEVIVEVDSIPVVIPPGEVLDQWYEMWSGGGCQRRCDGLRQVLVDRPCACPADPLERQAEAAKGKACKPTTRVRFMLPDVADVGTWRLESHGFHAAAELGGSAGLVATASKAGAMIPADIALSPREGARRPGEPKKTFFVPVISFRGTLGPVLEALGILDGDAVMPRMLGVEPRPAISSGGAPALPSGGTAFDPAPVERASFPGPAPTPTPPEQAPTPPAPTTAPPPGPGFAPPATTTAPAETPVPLPAAYDPPPVAPPDEGNGEGAAYSGPQIIAIRFGDRGVKDRAEKLRLLSALHGRPIGSAKDLEPHEIRISLEVLADDLAYAELVEEAGPPPQAPDPAPLSPQEPPEAPSAPTVPSAGSEPIRGELVDDSDIMPGSEFDGPVASGEPPLRRRRAATPHPEGMDGAAWRAHLAARQVKVTEVIREAHRLAPEGTTPPGNLDQIAASGLAPALLGFVEETARARKGEGR